LTGDVSKREESDALLKKNITEQGQSRQDETGDI
jgi:hypothetical protein